MTQLSPIRIYNARNRGHIYQESRIYQHVPGIDHAVGLCFMKDLTLQDHWARPYFDPTSKELRLQDSQGHDMGVRKPAIQVAQSSKLRSFLELAILEGLLDSIPGESSTSTGHIETVLTLMSNPPG